MSTLICRYSGGHYKSRHESDNRKYSQSFNISFHRKPSLQLHIKAAASNGVQHWDNNPPSSQFDQPMGDITSFQTLAAGTRVGKPCAVYWLS